MDSGGEVDRRRLGVLRRLVCDQLESVRADASPFQLGPHDVLQAFTVGILAGHDGDLLRAVPQNDVSQRPALQAVGRGGTEVVALVVQVGQARVGVRRGEQHQPGLYHVG